MKVEHLLGIKRTEEVRRLVAPHLAQNPGDAELHYHLARAAYLDDDTAQAREHLGRVLALEPSHEGARFLLYHVMVEEKDYPEAELVVTELIRENPDDPDYIAAYARLMLMTLHLEKARALTREALRLDPEHRGALLVEVLIATARGEKERANVTLEAVLKSDPNAYQTTATLYYLLIKQNRFREAQKVGQQLLRADPGNADLVDSLVEIRTVTHWAALPAFPGIRFGWAGVAALWVVGVVGGKILARYDQTLASVWTVTYIGLCVYSWVYSPILKRLIRARGI